MTSIREKVQRAGDPAWTPPEPSESKPQYRLVANASVTFLPSWREIIRACAYLSPDTLCDVYRPDGSAVCKRSAAREVTGLGKPLGAMLRQKAQARRSR